MINGSGTFGANQSQQACIYGYSAIGNLTNKCGTLLTYGDVMHPSAVTFNPLTNKSYTYDANGNMLTRGNQTLTWNIDNRVTQIAISGGGTTLMEYDYAGIRVKKSAPGGITLYPFSGYEIDPNGVITKSIRIGIETFASKKGTNKYFYHNDHLGSVNVITNSSGARVQLNEYEPWGAVSRAEGSIDPDQRFTGQKLDPETGLYYYVGRYYDAEIGRFISADPFVQAIFDPQNLNRYSYVINNPQNYIDPDGYFHQVKKKKKHGGFWRIFSSIFTIVLSVITLQPELAALGFATEIGVNAANLAWGLAGLASGIGGLASGLGDAGPPGAGGTGTSSPAIFNNSGIMRISSGDFPGEEPWWRSVNLGGWWCIVCDAQAAGGDNDTGSRGVPPGGRLFGKNIPDAKPRAQKPFDFHPRVEGQLNDPSHMGRLSGKLTTKDIQNLSVNPAADRYFDVRTGNINVINKVDGVTLRITVPRNDMRIISVGRARPNNIQNLVNRGDWVPLP